MFVILAHTRLVLPVLSVGLIFQTLVTALWGWATSHPLCVLSQWLACGAFSNGDFAPVLLLFRCCRSWVFMP